jgi:hypothetical protein
MKIVRVQYTVAKSFVPVNQENIRKITAELEKLHHPGIHYSAYLLADGQTFMHLDTFSDEAAHEVLQQLQSFKLFDAALSASGWLKPPELEFLIGVSNTQPPF